MNQSALPSHGSPRLRLTLLAAVVAAPLLVGGRARAAVTIVMQRGASTTSTLYVDGDKMRAENPGKERGATVIIDAVGKRMLMVNDAAKTYNEITEADMKRFGEQIAARRAQMEERMKSMPPEQRAHMEQLMAGMTAKPGAKRPDLKFEKMGDKKTVNGFSCQMYRVLEADKPKEEDCLATWSATTLQRGDFEGLRKFAEQMAKDVGVMGAGGERQMFEQFDKYPGFPVSRHPLEPGQHEDEQLMSIKRGAIPAAKFVVPAGYTKTAAPIGPGAMGGGGPPHGNFRPMPTPTQ